MSRLEVLYTTLLLVALVGNGFAVAGSTSIAALVEPLRERRTLARVVALDLLLVPLVIIGTATLLDVDPVTRAGLVIVGAASCGPISIALARIAGGDVPLSITLVLGLGALNFVTLPLITGLFLPTGLLIPLEALLSSLFGLAVAPLGLGFLGVRLLRRRGVTPRRMTLTLEGLRRGSDLALAAAVAVALLLEPRDIAAVLRGPVLLVALITMTVVTVAARGATRDPAQRSTLTIALNARAIGLALAVATLHLGDVDGLRPVVLAYGGLTQAVPLLVILATRGRGRALATRSAD